MIVCDTEHLTFFQKISAQELLDACLLDHVCLLKSCKQDQKLFSSTKMKCLRSAPYRTRNLFTTRKNTIFSVKENYTTITTRLRNLIGILVSVVFLKNYTQKPKRYCRNSDILRFLMVILTHLLVFLFCGQQV